ncbi:MAG TPA: RHS repeat-associated core domain-containing protein [Steroidobacteraceae bacterium]
MSIRYPIARVLYALSLLACLLTTSVSVQAQGTTTGESSDIQFNSPAASSLRSAALTLVHPVLIYEYVRNNYEYALYHGARSGSVNTFLGGRGNDVDLAATLIAMLRARGTPARYAVGTVRIASSQVTNWLGVENVDLAYGILRDQGIQGVVLSADKSTLDFEHVWVEALVAYTNYRGAGNGVSCVSSPTLCNWVALDPSFKQRGFRNSGLDPYTSLTFDYTAYYNAIRNNDSARRDKSPLEIYEEQMLGWLRTNAPGKTLEDIADFTDLIREERGLLPASLPYSVIGNVRRYNSVAHHDAAVPATELKKWGKALTLKMRVGVTNAGSTTEYTINAGSQLLTDLTTQRLTLATDLVGGVPNMVLRLGGVEIVRMLTIGTISGYTPQIGDSFTLELSLDGSPAAAAGTDQLIEATYPAIVGGYYLIATGGETSTWTQVHRAADALLDANTQYQIVFNPGEVGCQPGGINCTPYVDISGNGWNSTDPKLLDYKPALDALTGGLLEVAGTQYYAKLREQFARLDSLNKVKTPIAGFLGVVSTTYDAEYIDGTAYSVLPGGLLIDMKGIALSGSWRIAQAAEASNKQFELVGHISSSLEHEIWQELTGYDAISTVRGIQMAMASGATLVNPKKNLSVDTVPAMYASFGYGSIAPAPFTLAERTIYGTRPATWSHPTADFTQSFVAMKRAPSGTGDTRLANLNYDNSFHHENIGCFYDVANTLQSLLSQYGGSAQLLAGGLCLSSYPEGTTVQQAITLHQSDYATYQTAFITPEFFDYLDEVKGFSPVQMAYRSTTSLAVDAPLGTVVSSIRDNLYLRDLNVSWGEYLVPSRLSVGPNYRFSVAIHKDYDTPTGKLIAAGFEILNASITAGGGYVSGDTVLNPAQAIAGTATATPTFNNATLTDRHTISETNNDPIKTASTVDPVSTVTGNNYHDETDLLIKGRGLNYVFTRTYNSTASSSQVSGPLGYGWTHSYAMRLKSNDYGSCANCGPGSGAGQRPENGNSKTASISYTDERGGEHNYLVNEASLAVTAPQGEFDSLTFDSPAAGQHTITFRNGVKYIFEGPSDIKTVPGRTARLKQIVDPVGNQLNFAYDGSARLSTVTDNLGIAGRTGLVFTYSSAGFLSRITDWSGRQWNYSVNASSHLASYTNPLTQQMRYTYHAGTHRLNEIIKPLQRDGLDVKTEFKYYENGRTFFYASALNQTETLDYDLYRKTTRVSDPRFNTREYQYDDAGRLVKLTEPDGAILQFSNAVDGLRNQKADGLGYQTRYSYRNDKSFSGATDTGGNLTREQDALNQTIDTTYGIYDQVASVKNKRGTVESTSYFTSTGGCGFLGRPSQRTLSALSGRTNVALQTWCWNADGTLQYTDELNATASGSTLPSRRSSYFYQAGSIGLNVERIALTSGTLSVERTYTYDTLGRKKTETSKRRTSPTNAALLDITTVYDYDALDRVIRVTDAVGNILETVYDANGQVERMIGRYKQPDGTFIVRTIVSRFYDAADRMIAEADALEHVRYYQYDANNNVVDELDANNNEMGHDYDAMKRRISTQDGNGTRTATVYDLAGQVTSVANGNGDTIRTQYDAIGRLTRVTDARGFITQFSYDANGNLTCRVDANAQASLKPINSFGCTEYREYDELNRVTRVVDALNGSTRTGYDLQGNVVSITDAANKTTLREYDGLGRLIATIDPYSHATQYLRDEAGNAYQVTNRMGQVTRVTVDVLNRATRYDYLTDGTNETITFDSFGDRRVVANSTVTYSFTYDSMHRLTGKTDSRSNKSLVFTYDAANNLLTKQDYQGDLTEFQYDSTNRLVGMSNNAYLKASYQYDPAGRLLSRNLSNDARTEYSWDPNGWLSGLKMVTANGTVLSNTTYLRDRVGNILTQVDSAGTTSFVYDALYRLTSADYPGSANDEFFTYDGVGNRQTHTLGGQVHAYQYPANSDRLQAVRTGSLSGAIEKSFLYDDEGRMTTQNGTGARTMTWDQKNRVRTVSVAGQAVTMLYDPLDYRIGRLGGTLGARDYYLEGEHLEAEYTSGTLQAKYFRGINTDELVAGFTLSGGTLVPSIFHHDQLVSVTGISAHHGPAVQTMKFGPFGTTQSTVGASNNRLQYTGRELDPESQLYYYRARYYDPAIGRFISEDPIGFASGDTNFYAYVGNNPVNANDPSGHDAHVSVNGTVVNIEIPITYSGNAVNSATVNTLNSSIASQWSGVIGKYQVTTTVTEGHWYEMSSNDVQLINGQGRSYVTNRDSGVWYQPGQGNPAWEASHESGHLMRLPDQYTQSVVNGRTVTTPKPGFARNIMGDYGQTGVREQDIADIIDANTPWYVDAWNAITSAFGPSPVSSGAAGGFLLYPNKANNNSLVNAYEK